MKELKYKATKYKQLLDSQYIKSGDISFLNVHPDYVSYRTQKKDGGDWCNYMFNTLDLDGALDKIL